MEGRFTEQRIPIPVNDTGGVTSGILTLPLGKGKNTAIVVAHGAGNDMNTALIVSFARGLAKAGYPVLRFNFLYTEAGKKAPDKPGVLVRTWQAALNVARKSLGTSTDSWVAAGKSMGGRVASQMAAEGILPVDRLIFLGYPLHRAGDREHLRDSHLYDIGLPMLFFTGTRDPLCNFDSLREVLERLKAPFELVRIEGGDHSFHVPRSLKRTDEEIFGDIIGETVKWLGK